jgi:hypothetical protein
MPDADAPCVGMLDAWVQDCATPSPGCGP